MRYTIYLLLLLSAITACSNSGGSSTEESNQSENPVGSDNDNANTSDDSNTDNDNDNSGNGEPGNDQIDDDPDQGVVSVFTDLPAEMRISEDGQKLETGGFYIDNYFDESSLETIYLDFAQETYLDLLEANYEDKVDIEASLTYKGVVYESVGARYRGNTSYRRATTNKNSFSIELNWQIEGQDINGYNNLKLNNAFEDPSAMREVLYSNLARRNIATVKANFVKLVVNGINYGIYSNVQDLDKDHSKQWFLDKDVTRWRAESPNAVTGGGAGSRFGAGTSSLNDLGENGADYESAYSLKSTDVIEPWQDLANAAHTLGTSDSSNLIEELSQYMDIDAALWFLASENAFGDDDSYINKGGMDYYVYFDITTGRIVPIEYDGNSAMGDRSATWSPFMNETDADFPLLNILLNIPELRQRYLAHYRTVLEESFNPLIAEQKINAYDNLINATIQETSPVAMYSYLEYQNAVAELKTFISNRYAFLQADAEVNANGLTISNVAKNVSNDESTRPNENQTLRVTAHITGGTIGGVYLYYSDGLMGGFTKVAMNDTGTGDDDLVSDGIFSGTIPAHTKGSYVRYYIEAIANDTANTASYNPVGAEHDVYIYQVKSAEQVESSVVINEIMPSNDTTAEDEEGEFNDWIELYNNSNTDVNLSGYFLTDEEVRLDRWTFPDGTIIQANSTLIIWADDKEGLTSSIHTNFNLSASGEDLFLVTPNLEIADQLSWGLIDADVSIARTPNGTGDFTRVTSPTFNQNN